MNRGLLNLVIDVLSAVLLTAMVATGYILWFPLPSGSHRTHMLWGLLRHQWGVVHFWISAALLGVLAAHVALHWRWLVTGLCRRFGLGAWAERSPRRATAAIVAAAAVPLVTVVAAAHVAVRPLATPLHSLASRPGTDAVATRDDDAAARAAVVLAEHCASCHGEAHRMAGVRADTLAALRSAQPGVWITPGAPERSRLFTVVDPAAAKPYHRLSESDAASLKAWIAGLPAVGE